MKFAEHLLAHITPEWRKQYINYEVIWHFTFCSFTISASHLITLCIQPLSSYFNFQEMKAMLYTAVEEAPSAESVGPEIIARHFSNFDEVFFQYCDKELKKINTFYSGKYVKFA